MPSQIVFLTVLHFLSPSCKLSTMHEKKSGEVEYAHTKKAFLFCKMKDIESLNIHKEV